jgi:RNase P subunit RPR2
MYTYPKASTCSKCGNCLFEVTEQKPNNSNYKLLFVQCSSCGSVVGVMDYYNIGARTFELEKKLDKIIKNQEYLIDSITQIEKILKNI